jgi:predicted outer membrane repeat protein
MFLTRWLRNLRSACHSGRTDRPRPALLFRPRLEALEDRAVPAQIGLTVSSLADSGPGTLRAAILSADAGSHSDKFTIGFSLTGTIDLQSPLPDLNNSITVQGPGAASLTAERAAGYSFASAIVTVDASQSASLSGLTIANGDAGGITNNGTLTVSGCTISGNSATIGGGGIATFSGTLTVTGSTLSNNSAALGGAIFGYGWNNETGAFSGTLTVSGCTLSGNTAASNGGAIWDYATQTLTVNNSTLCGNTAGSGGGLWAVTGLNISGCTFTSNTATSIGGGLDIEGGTVTVSGSTFTANHAFSGGGIFDYLSFPSTVSGSTFACNTATRAGGGINNASGLLTVSGSTLSANSAGSGGGIYNNGALVVSSSTLSGNSATGFTIGIFHIVGQGGAIANV